VSRPLVGPRQSVIQSLREGFSLVAGGFEIIFISRNVSAVICRQSCKILSMRTCLKLYFPLLSVTTQQLSISHRLIELSLITFLRLFNCIECEHILQFYKDTIINVYCLMMTL
jgi:hypothetical protein